MIFDHSPAPTTEGLAWCSVGQPFGAGDGARCSVRIAASTEGGPRSSEGEASGLVRRAPASDGLTGSSERVTFYSVSLTLNTVSLTLNTERECLAKKQALSLLDSGVCENAKSEL